MSLIRRAGAACGRTFFRSTAGSPIDRPHWWKPLQNNLLALRAQPCGSRCRVGRQCSLIPREVGNGSVNPLTGHRNRSVMDNGNFGGRRRLSKASLFEGVKLQNEISAFAVTV
jgi:hypothetical protein